MDITLTAIEAARRVIENSQMCVRTPCITLECKGLVQECSYTDRSKVSLKLEHMQTYG